MGIGNTNTGQRLHTEVMIEIKTIILFERTIPQEDILILNVQALNMDVLYKENTSGYKGAG